MINGNPEPKETPTGDPRFIKVLVVDDITYVVKSISRIFESQGYFVLTAKTGEEALDKFIRYSPDLITIDQKLPDMTGVQLVEQIRAHDSGKETKLIIISAVTDKNEIQSILNKNIDDYLVKPFKRARLIDTVRILLGLDNADMPAVAPLDETTDNSLDENSGGE